MISLEPLWIYTDIASSWHTFGNQISVCYEKNWKQNPCIHELSCNDFIGNLFCLKISLVVLEGELILWTNLLGLTSCFMLYITSDKRKHKNLMSSHSLVKKILSVTNLNFFQICFLMMYMSCLMNYTQTSPFTRS